MFQLRLQREGAVSVINIHICSMNIHNQILNISEIEPDHREERRLEGLNSMSMFGEYAEF